MDLFGDAIVGGVELGQDGAEDAEDGLGVEVALGDEVAQRREERGVARGRGDVGLEELGVLDERLLALVVQVAQRLEMRSLCASSSSLRPSLACAVCAAVCAVSRVQSAFDVVATRWWGYLVGVENEPALLGDEDEQRGGEVGAEEGLAQTRRGLLEVARHRNGRRLLLQQLRARQRLHLRVCCSTQPPPQVKEMKQEKKKRREKKRVPESEPSPPSMPAILAMTSRKMISSSELPDASWLVRYSNRPCRARPRWP